MYQMMSLPLYSGTLGEMCIRDRWYTEAVDWASQTDIVSGTGAGFDPEGSVTREQIASILYRYAKDVYKRQHLHRAWIHWRYDLRCLRRSAGAGRGNQNGSASVRRRVADGRDEPLAGVPDLRRQK